MPVVRPVPPFRMQASLESGTKDSAALGPPRTPEPIAPGPQARISSGRYTHPPAQGSPGSADTRADVPRRAKEPARPLSQTRTLPARPRRDERAGWEELPQASNGL